MEFLYSFIICPITTYVEARVTHNELIPEMCKKRSSARPGRAPSMRQLTLMLALLVPISAVADDTVAESVLTAYTALEGYCDTVAVQDQQQSSELSRCYARDGRYKRSEQFVEPWGFRFVQWGDTQRANRWSTHGGSTTYYAEDRARDWRTDGPPDGLAARALSAFLRSAQTEDQARGTLRSMQVVEDGADIVLQRQHASPVGTDVVNRVWVRRAEGFVIRAEETWNGRVAWSATLIKVRANPLLTQADLAETAPFFQRYSLQTRPRAFTGGLTAVAFAAGLILSVAWRRQRNWRRIWLNYAKGIGAVIASLAVLSVLSLGGGGHPPAIIVPVILGMYAALAALALAAFMLGMLLGDHLRSGRLSSGSSIEGE